MIRKDEHLLQAKTMKRRQRKNSVEAAFAALGEVAQKFHWKLLQQPVKPQTHLRRLLKLKDLYGREELLPAAPAGSGVRNVRRQLCRSHPASAPASAGTSSPTEVLPRCPEWIEETDYEPDDPASYDRFLEDDDGCTEADTTNHAPPQDKNEEP
ncbi:MAG: hypothetical protein R3E01_19215 [Pirellulaceae bacterium]